jgi:hypothetical protein
MKKDKIIYWTTTGIICTVMVYSVINFNLKAPIGPEIYRTEGPFKHLGLPDYMRIELSIAKALGVLALLIPGVPFKAKEFAYAGFAITLASAAFAHFSVGDGIIFIIDPLIFLCILTVSYTYFRKLKSKPAVTEQPARIQNSVMA